MNNNRKTPQVNSSLLEGGSNVCHLPQHLAHAKSLPSVKTEAHSKSSLEKYQAWLEHSDFGDLTDRAVRGEDNAGAAQQGQRAHLKQLLPSVSTDLLTIHPTLKFLPSRSSSVNQISFPQEGGGLAAPPEELARSWLCTRQRTATSNHLPPSNLCRTQRGIQCLPSSRSCKIQESALWMLLSSTLPPESTPIPTGCLQPCLAQQSRERKDTGNKDAAMTIDSIQQKQ